MPLHRSALLLSIFAAAACGHSSAAPAVDKATAMFVNITGSPVDVYWGEAVVARQLASHASSSCATQPVFRAIVGRYASPLAPIAGSVAEYKLAPGSRSTIVFEGGTFARIAPANDVAPATGEARLQFYTNYVDPLDVYVTATNAPLVTPTAVVGPVNFTPFVTVPANATRMRVTRAGQPGSIVLDVDPLPLAASRVGVTVIYPATASSFDWFTFAPCL